MEITKSTIKALASDTRLEMLRLLSQRRKIPADIAKLLKLAPSTVNEHLKILEEEGLVRRKETGHKWIYFEITEKGRSLVQPRSPMQFVIILGLGALMMLVGGFRSLISGGETFATQVAQKAGETATESDIARAPMMAAPSTAGIDWFMVLVLVAGLVLVAVGLYNIWKARKR